MHCSQQSCKPVCMRNDSVLIMQEILPSRCWVFLHSVVQRGLHLMGISSIFIASINIRATSPRQQSVTLVATSISSGKGWDSVMLAVSCLSEHLSELLSEHWPCVWLLPSSTHAQSVVPNTWGFGAVENSQPHSVIARPRPHWMPCRDPAHHLDAASWWRAARKYLLLHVEQQSRPHLLSSGPSSGYLHPSPPHGGLQRSSSQAEDTDSGRQIAEQPLEMAWRQQLGWEDGVEMCSTFVARCCAGGMSHKAGTEGPNGCWAGQLPFNIVLRSWCALADKHRVNTECVCVPAFTSTGDV